jgi:hypothetical protein
MPASLKSMDVFAGLVFITIVLMTDSAGAVSVEVAKKCDALTAKAFPPRVIGNPAAGSTKGTGADERVIIKNAWRMVAKCPIQNGDRADLGAMSARARLTLNLFRIRPDTSDAIADVVLTSGSGKLSRIEIARSFDFDQGAANRARHWSGA